MLRPPSRGISKTAAPVGTNAGCVDEDVGKEIGRASAVDVGSRPSDGVTKNEAGRLPLTGVVFSDKLAT
jgi:hypothetical protein